MKDTTSYQWYQQVWNSGNESAIDTLMSSRIVAHGLTEDVARNGVAGFKEFYRGFMSDFPSIHVEVKNVVREGDLEATHVHVTGTHRSGKEVSFDGMSMCRIENGQIAEAWNCFDFLTMNLQLGQKLVPDEPA